MSEDAVKIGIIGLGNMGMCHAKSLFNKKVDGAVLGAVADSNPEKLKEAATNFGSDLPVFDTAEALFGSGKIDAVIVATPHPCHVELVIKGLEKGLHMLCEKPAGVYTAEVEKMNAAADKSDCVFAIMFNQRTLNMHKKLKSLIESGELGEIRRFCYTITDWFRTQRYYDSGGWRATWRGEGGGVLLNQCPHNLDLMQWWFGLPKRLRSFCAFGKYHNIEVEDDVTTYMEFENGSTGLLITTTGEAPGSNRLEIACDRGKLVMEGGKLTFTRAVVPVAEYCKTTPETFTPPETWVCDIPVSADSGASQHEKIMAAFAAKIRGKGELVAKGQEGIRSLMLSNAMMLSSWTDGWVDFPIDATAFEKEIKARIATSKFEKVVVEAKAADMSKTF